MSIWDLFDENRVTQAADCIVEVGGREVSQVYPFLIEVEVDTTRNKAGRGHLSFETRRQNDGSWSILDEDIFVPGRTLSIKAGFGPGDDEEIIRGLISKITTSMPQVKGTAGFKVIFQDLSLGLDRTSVYKTWGGDNQPVSDGDILREILGEHQLSFQGGPGQPAIESLEQRHTDICFLKYRARLNGYELTFYPDHVYFGPFRFKEKAQEPIRVYAGRDTNCIDFSLEDDGHKPNKVLLEPPKTEGRGIERIEAVSDLPLLGPIDASEDGDLPEFVWRPVTEAEIEVPIATALAQDLANQYALKVSATGSLDGSLYGHVLRVGLPVMVDGVGERYSGKYYVDNVVHRFSETGYIQNFKLLRNAYGDNYEN